ncbi:hypothetical protein PH213_32690 [Streptomyces sp. SRF1]|uniref:hypothetical protein n=1 Tax=Streptomyces sp. SRF1 TaxID=1549642 RepID=UPI0025AFCA04|nr:hypothetical protein [Streptomyces sp. SRF1]MDN3059208.1 hypothetical protein [Streptomyces sp. SRF1]
MSGRIEKAGPGATCHLLKFSIRTNIATQPKRMAERLQGIMGCPFLPGYYHKEIPAWQADLLGMEIYLYEWRGIKNRRILRLHGASANSKFAKYYRQKDANFVVTDIGDTIIDLLGANGGGTWYVPSEEDIEAELIYGKRISGQS